MRSSKGEVSKDKAGRSGDSCSNNNNNSNSNNKKGGLMTVKDFDLNYCRELTLK